MHSIFVRASFSHKNYAVEEYYYYCEAKVSRDSGDASKFNYPVALDRVRGKLSRQGQQIFCPISQTNTKLYREGPDCFRVNKAKKTNLSQNH